MQRTVDSQVIKVIFERIKYSLGVKTQKSLAEIFEVTPAVITAQIQKGSLYSSTIEYCLNHSKTLLKDIYFLIDMLGNVNQLTFVFDNNQTKQEFSLLKSIKYKMLNFEYLGEPIKYSEFQKMYSAYVKAYAVYSDIDFEGVTEYVDRTPIVKFEDLSKTARIVSSYQTESISKDIAQVPFFMSKVNAGKGISFETAPAKVDVSNYVLNSKDPKEVFIVEVSGNSMNQAGIIDGSTIIVKRSQDQKECINKVCVLTYQGETLVKYLLRETIEGKDVLVLRSKSTEDHKDIIVNYPEELILHGYVVTVATNF